MIRTLDELGIMINASFVFGLDGDDGDVFARTVEFAVNNGITTATFHILTPYPGTRLYTGMQAHRRLIRNNWDLYDTRHVVYRPTGVTANQLQRRYDWSYRTFYQWSNIFTAASNHESVTGSACLQRYKVLKNKVKRSTSSVR